MVSAQKHRFIGEVFHYFESRHILSVEQVKVTINEDIEVVTDHCVYV